MMKSTLAATVLAAAATAATAQSKFYMGAMTYRNIDKFVEKVVDIYRSDHTFDFKEDVDLMNKWYAACVPSGEYDLIIPETETLNIIKAVDQKAKAQGISIENKSDLPQIRALVKQELQKVDYRVKLFFVSTPEKMAQSECAKSVVEKFFAQNSLYKETLAISYYDAVPNADLTVCAPKDIPICETEKASTCAACSYATPQPAPQPASGAAGILASTVAAAAVALAFFF